MASLLIAVIYLIFISLGLPDSLLGSGWPQMQLDFNVPSSYAGYVSMTIAFMTILSALISPKLINKFHTKYIVITSIFLTVIGLIGFSFSPNYWCLFLFCIPYGLGAGAIDSSINHYVASNCSQSVMSFLHCFYGVGAVISPTIMSAAIQYARWPEGYRWTSYIQIAILVICVVSLPLWKKTNQEEELQTETPKAKEVLKTKGVVLTLIAFFAYCSQEATCFLWVPSYFKETFQTLDAKTVASFGCLIFLGLTIGRILSGILSKKLSDKNLIRLGVTIELIGILILVLSKNYTLSAISFVIIGTGMGPVYPSIQHMAPINFPKKYSASIIGFQMASAYVGSTFMPMVFGNLQEVLSMKMLPYYLLIFTFINICLLEIAYIKINKSKKI